MMLGKNLLIALLVAISFSFGALKGQIAFALSYDTLNFPTPGTQSYGGTVRYTFNITNVSADTLSDSLYIKVRTDSSNFTLVAYDTVTIAPSGVFTVDTIDTVVPLRYGGGINILVIWPTSPTFFTTDSITDTLIVIGVSADEGLGNHLHLDVFPIPTQMQVFLRSRDPNLCVRETRMLNATGQMVRREEGLPHCLDLGDLPRGIYFIWIEDEDGASAQFKVIKQ